MSSSETWDEQRYLEYLKRLTADLRSTRKELAEVRRREHEPIAIVGAGCRYPGGVTSPAELWELVDAGGDAIGPFPPDRGWPVADDAAAQGGFLHDAGDFDAGFFAMGPREALATDPQQRLVLTVAWEALERAGIDPATLRGSASGVFVGAATSGYGVGVGELPEGVEGHLLAGGATSVISGRTAYHLGWEGPVATVDTACSSSLVAMHLAVTALRRGECSLALAGGVAVMATPAMFAQFSAQQGLASDGRCKAFSDAADGTSWSEGAGVVLLERLSDAQARGRHILGVIRGTAINADGASNGLTAPHGPSQQRVIRAALEDAGLGPADVDAVDAHGTGTSLGDPIEAQALLATYGQERNGTGPLRLGALKSNLGHTQSAAGVGGVLKMLAAMEHGRLPRTLHVDAPSSKVDWDDGEVALLTDAQEWPDGDRPRRAAVSSFGISGTNAHVVLEQAPAPEPAENDAAPGLGGPLAWPVSARSAAALAGQAGRLAEHLAEHLDGEIDPVAVTQALVTTRSTFEHRAVVLGDDRDALLSGLGALASGEEHGDVVTGTVLRGRTAMLFPGQGSQHPAMGRTLAAASPVAAAAFEEIFAAFDEHLPRPLREVLFADPDTDEAALLDDTRWTQPALFAVEVATYRVWESWGVVPQALVGHSIGTLAAAHVAGVLSLPDAAALVAARARLMADLPAGGAMLAVAASEDDVRADLEGTGLDLAAVNGPSAVVVSGDADAVDALAERCTGRGVRARRLRVSHAFHSARMEPALAAFREVAARCDFGAPRIPIVSDHTGAPATAAQLRDPDFWADHLRHTVRFADAITAARGRGVVRFLEVGPGDALATAARTVADGDGRPVAAIGGFRRDADEVRATVLAAARLHVAGGAPSWTAIVGEPAGPPRLELPTYAFDPQRYWMTPDFSAPAAGDPGDAPDWERRFWDDVERGDADAVARALDGVGPDAVADVVPALAAWRRDRREADAVARLRHRVRWQPGELPDARPAGAWLAVDLDRPDRAPTDDATVAALRERGLDITPVGELGDLEGITGVLVVAGTDLAALVATVRTLAAHPDAPRLWVLTRGAVATGPRDPDPDPAGAGLWGAGRALALERSAVWGGLVDLPEGLDVLDRRTTTRLLAVLSGAGEEDQVALRGATAMVRRLAPYPTPEGPRTPWRPHGTVLITGGTGALGAAVARLAARRAEPGRPLHLVLVGRRGPDAPGAAELAAELTGPDLTVDLVAADAADRDALAGVLAGLDDLTAVVHAAGVGDETPVDTADADTLAAVVAGKAAGAEHLDALTGDLEEFVLFSSIAGTWGAGGQSAYAAANARLDALAERRARAGLPATSVAWGPWSGAGMAADPAAEEHLRRRGLAGLDPERALGAFEQLLAEAVPTAVVADVDWPRFLATYTLARPAPLFAAVAPAPAAAPVAESSEPASDLARRVVEAGPAQGARVVLDAVRVAAAAVLGHDGPDAVDPDRTFGDLGVDSVAAVDLRDRLTGPVGTALPATAVFDHPTPRALAQFVLDELLAGSAGTDIPTAVTGAADDDPVVVVGMACRFPGGVDDPEALWRLVAAGGDAIGPLPTDRGWDLRGLDDAAGGFLADVAGFDAAFFGISPREALAMDPQQRLLLETAWEAVERSGIAPSSLRGSRTGVFVGAGSSGYGVGTGLGDEVAGHVLTGTAGSVMSGRVAYVLGAEGPAVTVDTACSSSLVALHWAASALRAGECELALVGGATVMATPFAFGEFSAQGGLAHDGRCKAFGDDADGTGWSEGAAMIAVERLSTARAAGRPVLAVVAGSAVNSDGASNGLTAPNGPSQQRVLRAALADAGLTPADVDAVEAHGTGTTLGDPIEAQALLAVYGGERETPLRLGSVKSNIGHTQAAAGLSGVIKMIKALEQEQLPPTLHAGTPSRHVDWSSGAIELLHETTPWAQNGHPRRAGVSSFGISGTNAHVILESVSDVPSRTDPRQHAERVRPLPSITGPVPWLVSGRTPQARATAAGRLADAIIETPDDAEDLARAAARARDGFEHRAVVLAATTREAVEGLREPAITGEVVAGTTGLLLGGQGAQRPAMGRALAAASPVYAEALETAAAAVDAHLRRDRALLDVMHHGTAVELGDTAWAQPALFAVQVAGARLLEDWGLAPATIVGHSVGEIAAARLAGALSLDDAARLVAARAEAMAALPRPSGDVAPMAAVSGDPDRLAALVDDLPDGVVLSARNASTSVVLASDDGTALAALLDELGQAGDLRIARLKTSHAFHSPAMAPAADALAAVAAELAWAPPRLPVVSTATGAIVGPETWADPAHWAAQLTAPVAFADAVTVAARELDVVRWVEVGPHPTLTGHVTGDHPDAVAVCLGDARREEEADDAPDAAVRSASTAAATLWTAGADLPTWLPAPARIPASLPTTPFRHERFWPRAGRLPGGAGTLAALGLGDPAHHGGAHPLLAAAVRVAARDEVVLTGVVGPATHPWVADHVVPGSADPVLPGTALLELVVRAGDETGTGRVEDLTLAAPLVVPAAGVRVQVAVGAADEGGRREVTVHSAPPHSDDWIQHAAATVTADGPAPDTGPFAAWPPSGATALVEPEVLYDRLAAGGFAYGPALRGLTGVWRTGDELWVEARLPEAADEGDGAPAHVLHPALLDAVLHGLAAVDSLPETEDPGDLPRGEGLPFSWGGAALHAAGATTLRARLRRGPDGGVALTVADGDGAPVATVDELRTRPAGPTTNTTPATDGVHVVGWVPETSETGDAPTDGDRLVEVPAQGVSATTAAVLALVQEHLTGDDDARLVVVTRGAVAAGPGERPDPAQAAVAGLVRAAAAEEPGRVALLDLEPGAEVDGQAGPAESEVAVRGGVRLVPRWSPVRDRDALTPPEDGPWHLAITEKGSLDHLVLAPFDEASAPLEAGQVRLAVRAVGLNFRDVLNALGMYPGEAGALGSEAAGVVTEVADDVTGLAVGDRVAGLVPGAGGPVAVADARLLVPVPAGWTDAQAAGAPVVYLTAYRALVDLADARPGERLLVHAATGGVGLATLDLAAHLGLEVHGTASAPKQDLLRARGLGEDRIASSRDLAFADRFGEVDIVLNSLAGEFVDASLGLLGAGGRFLEMGKTDVRAPDSVPDGISYTSFDMWDAGVERIAEMLAALSGLFADGALRPLPVTAWDVADAREAFRHVSQARHVGKVVLTVPPTTDDGLVVLTGAFGGLGAAVARHLVATGTRRLLLAGRRGAEAPGAEELLAELRDAGAEVDAAAVDAADPEAVATLADRIPAPALIVHAAGVLDDGVVTAQSPERLEGVLRAKTGAVTVLDEHLAGPGTAMIVFSSVAGVLGAAGQSTYAAANAALDAWATTRRRDGAARWSLAWGPWAQTAGMTSGLGEADAARMARSGFVVLDPERGLALLDACRGRPEPALVVAPTSPQALAAAGEDLAPALRGLRAGPPATRRRSSTGSGDGAAQDLAATLAALPDDERAAALLAVVRETAAGVLGHAGGADAVPAERDFRGLGFDSLTSVELRNRLSAATGRRLPATLVFDHPTPRRLAEHLLESLDLGAAPTTVAGVPAVTPVDDDPIAVVGIGLRLPGGVTTPEDYWRLLADGVDAVGAPPADRGWERAGPGGTDATAGVVGGFVAGAGDFDAAFFGIAPREALTMDPQQRLLLETSWEAVERAGIDPATLRGSRTGVYAGTNYQGYGSAAHALPEGEAGPSMTGHAASVTSGRVAYALGLEGPAVTVDTACSSSSVALHWAASALRAGECDRALAGGVTIMATPGAFAEFSRQGGLAGDGRCKAFADGADGTGWGEGAGVVLLERLSDARAAGHRVLAVVRGSAINSDGASNGLTAPNGPAQQRVIRDALAAGGLTEGDVDAVEAHGTGTSLGDPIEAQALLATYGSADRATPLLLGSVKSNIGHTQAAAGVAGVIKAVLALQHGVVPPTLHAADPSSRIDWEDGEVALVHEATDLPALDRPARIGVSSFGISGTNAHVIVEAAGSTSDAASLACLTPDQGEHADRAASSVRDTPVLWPVSARDDAARTDRARALLAGPAADEDVDPADLGHALATTRTPFARRAVVAGREREELTAGLRALARGDEHDALITSPDDVDPDAPGKLAFVFSGQGAQRVGMGADLLATQPVYAEAFDAACAALDPHLPEPLRPVILGAGSDPDLVHRTDWTQPALFAVEVALAALVRSWGLRPDLMLGHSVGGLAAAHVAGAIDLDDAARLVAARGALMAEMRAGGAMVALEATEDEVRAELVDGAGIGAVNGPTAVVVSGDADAVDAVAAVFDGRGRRTRRLRVSHAFHSTHMDGMRERFAEVAATATFAAPRVGVVSDLTGAPVTSELLDPDYWVRHVREPVRFGDGVDALLAAGATTILEIGPDASLTPLVATVAGPGAAIPLVHRDDETLAVARAAAGLHTRGALDSLAPLMPEGPIVPLPTYPFRRQRFWLEPAVPAADATTSSAWDTAFWAAVADGDLAGVLPGGTDEAAAKELLAGLAPLAAARDRAGRDAETDAWLYTEAWVPVPDPAPAAPTGTWTVVGDGDLADALIGALRTAGAEVATDPAGPVVALIDAEDPATAATTVADLVRTTAEHGAGPLWVVTRGAADAPGPAAARGIGRVAALEHPDVWGGLIDLPAGEVDAARLLAVVEGAGAEDQLALRPDGLLARRLRPTTPGTGDTDVSLDGPVVITGGTGALGRRVARHLAGRGAQHLVLASRSGGGAEVDELAEELDIWVDRPAVDVADPDALRALLDGLPEPPSLVVHAAGVLDDGALAALDADRIATVVAPKAALAAIDEATRSDATTLVAFTSYAGVVGSPGQGNYAAANAAADAVIRARRAAGHPGLAVAWGPWAGDGMASGAGAGGPVTPLDPDRALDVLDRLLAGESGDGVVLVADADWDGVAAGVAALRPAPLLADLTDAAAGTGDAGPAVPDLRAALADLRPADREERLVVEVRRVVGRVLGHDGDAALDAVPASRAFRDLGLDSLMAVDLRNRLAAGTGLALPPNLLFDHPTAAALGAHLAGELATALGGGTAPRTRRSVLDELDRLESLLAGSRAGTDERRRIGDRLAALAAAWGDPAHSNGNGHHPEDEDPALDTASADEVFAFIDNDLGL